MGHQPHSKALASSTFLRLRLVAVIAAFVLLPLILWALPVDAARSSTTTVGPVLSIAESIPAAYGATTVEVPIILTTGTDAISAIAFSVDFDEQCLSFSTADINNNGVYDAVVFTVPAPFFPSVGYNAADPDGELDFTIIDYSPPFASMPTGTIVTITFGIKCAPPAGQASRLAPVLFSTDPIASFGNPLGQDVIGSTVSGSVLIYGPPLPTPVTPVEPTITVIDECGEYGSVVFAITPGVTYSMLPANATEGIVTVSATAQTGYVLQGYDGPWQYDLGTYYACPIPVTPLEPTVNVIDQCNEYGSVTLPVVEGVVYTVSPEGATEGAITVSATALPGFVLVGYTEPWQYDLGTFEACPPGDIPVTPERPVVNVIDECGEYGSIELADTEGVTYFTSVTNPTVGVVVVSAVAEAGYVLQGYDGPWEYDLGTYYACPTAVTPVKPTVNVIDQCGEYGSVLFAVTPGVTYSMLPANAKEGEVTVFATARAGYVLQGYDGPWEYNLGSYYACPIAVTPVKPTVNVIDQCGEYGSVIFAVTPGVTYSMLPANAKEGEVTVFATARAGYVLEGYDGPWEYDLGTYEACTVDPPKVFLPLVWRQMN